MKEKIALYLPNLRGGGAQRVILNLAQGLSTNGYQIDLVVANAVGPLVNEIPSSAKMVDLKSKGTLASLPRLIRYLKCEKPSSMLSTMSNSNVVAIIAKLLSKTKARLIVREANTLTSHNYYRLSPKEFVLFTLMRFLYKKADLVIANSNDTGYDLIKYGLAREGRLRVIHNPIVSQALLDKQIENNLHPWFQKYESPIILSIGRLHRQKDFNTLIRAFNIVRKKRVVRMIILGEGEERIRLQCVIDRLGLTEDIDLAGFTNNPHSYLYHSSVFVLCSKWEGFGNVLVEALAAGIPVVSSDCPGGPKEILDYGKIGRLVPVGDFRGFAEAIIDALDNPPDKSQLKQHSKIYSIDTILPLYADALNCKKGPNNPVIY